MLDDLKNLLDSLNVHMSDDAEQSPIARVVNAACALAYTLGVLRGQHRRGLASGMFGHDIDWEAVFGLPEKEES